jgi:TetR/AcrR family acrAB operon transcriptional repressor
MDEFQKLSERFALDEKGLRILVVTARLILHFGYDKTTMSDVATEAGVSKSTLYFYWKSKDELVRALLMHETLALIDDWLRLVEEDPQGGTLFGMYRHGFRALLMHPVMHTLYTKESHVLGAYVRQHDPIAHVRPYQLNRLFVQQLQAAGLVRTDLRHEVINHVLVMISVGLFSIGELVPPEITPSLVEVTDALAEMIQRALAPDPGGDAIQGQCVLRELLNQLIKDAREL